MHILSVALRDVGDLDDMQMSRLFAEFCEKHKEELEERKVRRITFAALKR